MAAASCSFCAVDVIEAIGIARCGVGSALAPGHFATVVGATSRARKAASITAIAIERTDDDDLRVA
jgi:hypothetical protein